jgi:hypothetical protein
MFILLFVYDSLRFKTQNKHKMGLTGILKTPAGAPWYGNRTSRSEFYRAQVGQSTRSFLTDRIDRTVIETVAKDLQSPVFVAAAVKSTREKFAITHAEEITATRTEIAQLDARSSRLLDVASELKSPAPVLRKVDELERQRGECEQRIVASNKEDESANALANVTDAQVDDARPHGRRDAPLRARRSQGVPADDPRPRRAGSRAADLAGLLSGFPYVVGLVGRPRGDSN